MIPVDILFDVTVRSTSNKVLVYSIQTKTVVLMRFPQIIIYRRSYVKKKRKKLFENVFN